MAPGIFLGTKFHSSQNYVEWYLYSNYPVHNLKKIIMKNQINQMIITVV